MPDLDKISPDYAGPLPLKDEPTLNLRIHESFPPMGSVNKPGDYKPSALSAKPLMERMDTNEQDSVEDRRDDTGYFGQGKNSAYDAMKAATFKTGSNARRAIQKLSKGDAEDYAYIAGNVIR